MAYAVYDNDYNVKLKLEPLDLRKLLRYNVSSYREFRSRVCRRSMQYGELVDAIQTVNKCLSNGDKKLTVRLVTPDFNRSLDKLKESEMELIRLDYNMVYSLCMWDGYKEYELQAKVIYNEFWERFLALDQALREYKELKGLPLMVNLANGHEYDFYCMTGTLWREGKLSFKAYRRLLALFYREYGFN